MCAIAGIVWNKISTKYPQNGYDLVDRMLVTMKHRGPDGKGITVGDYFAIGHGRLAIIDTVGGAQPLEGCDKKVHLICNGEIYGYRDLMAEQKNLGWEFSSESDSETLLAGYIINGPDFDLSVNGMYAYAIVDERGGAKCIQLAVDPLGIKPLYIARTNCAVVFASELNAILSVLREVGGDMSRDHESLKFYLTLGWVPPPMTLVKGVEKMAPGTRLRISIEDFSITRLQPRSIRKQHQTNRLEQLEPTLEKVIKRQLISDVPIGFFLSGGIDSSLLVAVANNIGFRPKTFTVRFEGGGPGFCDFDESSAAKMVANYYATDHHQLVVTSDNLRKSLDEVFVAMDQPIADPACLPLLIMAKFARESVKVCISGDGGDELFLGYPRHKLLGYHNFIKSIPRFGRETLQCAVGHFPRSPSIGIAEKLRKVRVGIEILMANSYFVGPFSCRHLSLLNLSSDWQNMNDVIPRSDDDIFTLDVFGQLSGQMLPKTDHITMYTGLETRVPYLDLEMIDLALSIPKSQKIVNGVGKCPLRNLLHKYVPEISSMPKKGFRVPLTSWFRNELKSEVSSRLLDSSDVACGLISRKSLEKMLTEHFNGEDEHSIRIWALLALESWNRRAMLIN